MEFVWRSRSWILVLALSSVAFASVPAIAQCPAALVPDADAGVSSDGGGPGGFDELLEVSTARGRERQALLHFDLRELTGRNLTVHRARLELSVSETSGARPWRLALRSVDEPWDEASVRWGSSPASQVQYGLFSSFTTSGRVSIDMTSLVRHWLNGEREETSVRLLPTAGSNFSVQFLSRDGAPEGPEAPRLVIECAEDLVTVPLDPAPGDTAQRDALNLLSGQSLSPPSITLGPRGGVRSASFELKIPKAFRSDARAAANWFVSTYKGLLRLSDPTTELQLARESDDGLHLVYRQRHRGIPVEGAELIVHLTDSLITGVSGHYAPELTVFTEPRLSASEGVALALAHRGDGAERYGDSQLRIFVPQLLNAAATANPRLAWRVQTGIASNFEVLLLDAANGALLQTAPARHDVFDLSLNTVQGADPNVQWTAGTCWMNSTSDVEWFTEAGAVSNPNPAIDTEGQTANTNINTVYNYWFNQLSRDSWDNAGLLIGMYIKGTMSTGANAFYSPACDQLDFHTGTATLDIVGHEYTHGVIQHGSNLIYARQSGALNESFADMFGFFVDPANTTIGEGSTLGTLRDLSDPNSLSQPDHMLATQSTDQIGFRDVAADVACDNTNDSCRVHTNSGITNKAQHLIIAGGINRGLAITGLGRAYAAKLFRNVIVDRLTTTSDFLAARDAEMAEAARLAPVPATSFTPYQRSCQVRNAFASVGVGTADPFCVGAVSDDSDLDGVPDSVDNCISIANSSQWDQDKDNQGNACDPDDDGDTVPDAQDNCPYTKSANTNDVDNDGYGDPCDDSDVDGVMDDIDNCRLNKNTEQRDSDGDLLGNVCDLDDDNDGVPDTQDNCWVISNPNQLDTDGDAYGDACDLCPTDVDSGFDTDSDGLDNVCDPDDDADGKSDAQDNCPLRPNPQQGDLDGDGTGNECDPDWPGNQFGNRHYWDVTRPMHWERVDLPLELPLQICPWCPVGPLPKHFNTVLDVQFERPVRVLIVDGHGMVVGKSLELSNDHHLVLRPAPFAATRFDMERGLFDQGVPAAGAPGYLAADQTRYTMQLYAGPEVTPGADYGLSLTQHTCDDIDGDGYGSPGDIACPNGAVSDCDDSRIDVHPAATELCDNRDNDCNGVVDNYTTTCGAGTCQRSGTCNAGVNSCSPGNPSSEVCDGLDNNCSGAADDGLTPTQLPVLNLTSPDLLSWSAVPTAAGYDVTSGDVGLLSATGGSFTQALSGCRAHETPATSLLDTGVPAPGQAIWYLVRALGCIDAATYDDNSPRRAASRDASINASPVSCGDCPHDTCVTGTQLQTSCGTCASRICSVDPFCCNSNWDSICVSEVRTVCQSARCGESQAACSHTLCSTGAPLAGECDAPVWGVSCTSAICAGDPFCCSQSWDASCVAKVETVCGRHCD